MGRVFARPGSECSVSANVSLGLNRFYHECNDQEIGADTAFLAVQDSSIGDVVSE